MFSKVEVNVENKTNKKVTITFDEDNTSTENFVALASEGEFSITSSLPCFALYTIDDGETYSLLSGTQEDETTCSYTFD